MQSEATIELNNVSIFQKNNLILSNISVNIDKGEFIYLIGRTGSGKSSFLKVLYGDLHIAQGAGSVAGFDLFTIKGKQIPFLRRKLGIVFQDFQLLTDRSVYDNLLFVLKATGWSERSEMLARTNEVLEKVGLGGKGTKMPYELSGGEQQRVVIARALLNNPDIILADEPTGNLDPDTTDEVMRLLIEISKSGCAVIMATHNYTLLEKFPARILKCEKGFIIDTNTTAQNTFKEPAPPSNHGSYLPPQSESRSGETSLPEESPLGPPVE